MDRFGPVAATPQGQADAGRGRELSGIGLGPRMTG